VAELPTTEQQRDVPRHASLEGPLRALFDESPIAHQIVDPSGRCVLANRALHALIADGQPLDPEHAPARLDGPLRRAFAGEAVGTVTLPNGDGADGPGALVLELLPLRDGGRVAHVAIRYRKGSDSVDLARGAQRYRSLVEATSAIVFTTDAEGALVEPQPRWEAYTGQSWAQHGGFGWIEAVRPEDRSPLLTKWAETRARGGTYEVEAQLYHAASGHHRHVMVRGAPLRGPDGQVREWIGTVLDLHEQRHALQELGRLEREAKEMHEASRLKSEFLANMSHELRTPLNAVLGFAELLVDRVVAPDSPQHDEFLGHILASGRHLLGLIDEVLDLAKVEAGKLQFRPERVSLPQLVDEVRCVLQSTGRSRGVRIHTEVAHALPEAVLDPARFKQVLYNYLSNALKFSPPAGAVQVRLSREDEAHFRLEVIDHGQGIAPSDVPRLFVAFQQLEGGIAKRHGGTGLGLALTKRLVEAQGGRVGVTTAPGQGSTFHAVLPLHNEMTSLRPPAQLAFEQAARAGEHELSYPPRDRE